jgi:predicted transcriptional regulator
MNTRDMLHLTACSDLRRNILISLIEQDKSLGDLREGLEISSTTALHAIKELENNNLTFQQKNKNYALTNTGRIITLKLVDFRNAAEVLKKYERFWLEHDISGIPDQLFERIGWLLGSNLVEDTSTDIFKVHMNFMKLLSGARKIRGISSIYVPDYIELFPDLIINKKVDVELILTQEVLEKIDKKIINGIISDKSLNLKIYLTREGTQAAFTVTDYFFSLGLFHLNGNYDYNRDLLSFEKEGIEWGNSLFEWYLQKAERI